MNRRHVIDCMAAKLGKQCGRVLFAAMLTAGLSGCGDKDKVQDSAEAAPVEKPMTEVEMTAKVQKEIDETRAAIAEAVQLQNKLSTEIEVLQQLLEETETELVTQEDEVSRLEAQQGR